MSFVEFECFGINKILIQAYSISRYLPDKNRNVFDALFVFHYVKIVYYSIFLWRQS